MLFQQVLSESNSSSPYLQQYPGSRSANRCLSLLCYSLYSLTSVTGPQATIHLPESLHPWHGPRMSTYIIYLHMSTYVYICLYVYNYIYIYIIIHLWHYFETMLIRFSIVDCRDLCGTPASWGVGRTRSLVTQRSRQSCKVSDLLHLTSSDSILLYLTVSLLSRFWRILPFCDVLEATLPGCSVAPISKASGMGQGATDCGVPPFHQPVNCELGIKVLESKKQWQHAEFV